MARQIEYLVELQKVIERKYRCSATHLATVLVEEKVGQNNETVWRGFVEIFDLDGHLNANVCYAWQRIGTGGIRIFTVLGSAVIDSPNRAIQAAIFVDAEKPAGKAPAGIKLLKEQVDAGKKALYEAEIHIEDLDAIIHASQWLREKGQRRQPET
jgi:hypothetical protein